ncbi:GFA family protein [Pseudoruegeria sp. HB172150]|uniref:GFA family protein n=1 Tax=Pseudoruegeria sp. HB172150 TaxID=2721164 RepID=UPI001556819C|nr:GFA family protein [Pseudoruegeria sp. HB172150]
MTELPLPATGGCRCGAVRFEISASPFFSSACHCRGCQRMTGSAYSLTMSVPAVGFRVDSGDPVPGGLRNENKHMHCPDCHSWVFTRPAGADFLVNVRTTMLDNVPGDVPFIETCLAEALPYAALDAPHQFDGFPPEDQYEPLMRKYASERH